MEWQQGGPLRFKGKASSAGDVLRIEAPMLTSIEADGLKQLTVRGMKVPELTIRMKNLARIRLEESAVARWYCIPKRRSLVQADKATTSAGLNIQTYGKVSVQAANVGPVNVGGSPGQMSIRTGK